MPLPFKLSKHAIHHLETILGLWNPIGVPAWICVDEYSSYLSQVIQHYPDVQAMAKELLFIRSETMGLSVSDDYLDFDRSELYIAEELVKAISYYSSSS